MPALCCSHYAQSTSVLTKKQSSPVNELRLDGAAFVFYGLLGSHHVVDAVAKLSGLRLHGSTRAGRQHRGALPIPKPDRLCLAFICSRNKAPAQVRSDCNTHARTLSAFNSAAAFWRSAAYPSSPERAAACPALASSRAARALSSSCATCFRYRMSHTCIQGRPVISGVDACCSLCADPRTYRENGRARACSCQP